MTPLFYGMTPIWIFFLVLLVIWDMVWKGIALWKAGRNNHLGWFIALLIFNTAGILPIIYLAFFQPKKKKRKK